MNPQKTNSQSFNAIHPCFPLCGTCTEGRKSDRNIFRNSPQLAWLSQTLRVTDTWLGYPAVLPVLPGSHLPKQNLADSGTTETN